MLRNAIVAGLVAAAAISSVPAFAAETAKAAPAYSTETQIGILLDNPATKATLVKHIPELLANEQFDMTRSMSLKQVQDYAADMLPDDVLAKIDADLAKIPAE